MISTAEQLLAAGDIGRCELIRGTLRMMTPGGAHHGNAAARILIRLGSFVESRSLGELFTAETGFLIEQGPDTVCAPDAAFVRRERVAIPDRGYYLGPPDLAIEVRSPDDSNREVREKVQQWLDAGTLEVWVIDAEARSATVCRDGEPDRTLGADDSLETPLLPGFSVRVRDVL